MRATYRVARQTSGTCRFARVSVEVRASDVATVDVPESAVRDAEWRREAAHAARRALRELPTPYAVTVTEILATVIDTGVGDVYEATVRAIRQAVGSEKPHAHVCFSEPDLVAARFRDALDLPLTEVIEARHWYAGAREGDAESLTHVWFRFARRLPLHLHVMGETLYFAIEDPMEPVDMDEYGEIRVAPASPPDLLAGFVGRTLTGVTVYRGYTSAPDCRGVRLDFDGEALVIGAFADEWVLASGDVPGHLAPYWSAV
jgi:hypothetical protein